MHIVLTGATGFLGRPLVHALHADGHRLTILTRRQMPAADSPDRMLTWNPDGATASWALALDGADAVINLAGEPIAGKRWSAAQKERIIDSRVLATRSVVAAIQQAAKPPAVLINGSAVGYYGPRGDEVVTEADGAGRDFLATVCVEWEAAAQRAASTRTRVVCIRTGLVLEKDGGALPQMLPPFKFGVGGPVGSGRQYWPWIHRADWIALVQWAMAAPGLTGSVNATAPNPLPNAAFARALGRTLHRPAFLPVPGAALRLLLGEMAEGLLLSGQRAIPQRAERGGFQFRYAELDAALGAIFSATRENS